MCEEGECKVLRKIGARYKGGKEHFKDLAFSKVYTFRNKTDFVFKAIDYEGSN